MTVTTRLSERGYIARTQSAFSVTLCSMLNVKMLGTNSAVVGVPAWVVALLDVWDAAYSPGHGPYTVMNAPTTALLTVAGEIAADARQQTLVIGDVLLSHSYMFTAGEQEALRVWVQNIDNGKAPE